jgi:hypothetical protein
MTQPRKEQVKNLKTKYTRFNGVGTLFIGGGPVQTISNTVLEAFYDNLLASTKTGAVGGAESSSPAILYGGSGPFSLAAGNTLTVTIPGVAGGNPITVTVQAGDVVTLGGSPVVTTARMADRINQAVFGFGVTAPVAANVDGQLVLTSAGSTGVLLGDSAVITVTEVTPGILNVLGLSSTSAASAQGTTAPRRGLVTVSSDGLGGYVQLRKIDTTVADAVNSVSINALAAENVPEFVHGQPVFARARAFPGAVVNGRNIKLSYYRTGPMRPQVVTSQGVNKANFASLNGADSVSVGLDFGNGQTLNFSVSFSGITTVQHVVDRFNQALSTASLAATSNEIDATLPHVVFKLASPYRFSDPTTTDSFFFSLNGLSPLHFNPQGKAYTASEMENYLGALISSYGGLQGQAFQYNTPEGAVRVGIRSLNTDPSVSQVRIYPGNPGGSSPGQYMETLDMLGVTPGVYKGATIAALYGNDEVVLYCPSALPGANLTISGAATTMAKLGLPSGVNVVASVGTQATVAPASHALLPEMVEFHEERDDYDTVVQDFDNKSPYNALKPQDGVGNASLDQLLGPDGKLNASLLPRVLKTLGLDRLNLGQGMLGDQLRNLLTPKISTAHNYDTLGYPTLVYESLVDSSSVGDRFNLRVYVHADNIFLTQYCKIVDKLNVATCFTRDTDPSDVFFRDATCIWLQTATGIVQHMYRKSTDPSPWGLDDWKTGFMISPQGTGIPNEVLTVGGSLTGTSSEALRTRIGYPIPDALYTLLGEVRAPAGGKIRHYAKVDTSGGSGDGSFFVTTVNAYWDPAFLQWNKDVSGEVASKLNVSNASFDVLSRNAANNAAWSDTGWDNMNLNVSVSALTASFAGSLTVGSGLESQPTVAALRANRFTTGGNRRTLLFESPQAGPFANVPIRIYMMTGSSLLGQGLDFTYNARWNNSLNRWEPDDAAQKSYSWVMATDRLWFMSKDLPSTNWTEDPSVAGSWTNYSLLDHNPSFRGYTVKDGVFRVDSAGSVSNPSAATAPRANSVYAKSMIKSWGKIRGDGPLTFNVSLLDGFNCNLVGYDGGAGAYIAFYATAMANTHYAIQFSGRSTNQNTTPPNEPGSYFTWVAPQRYLYSAVLIGQATTAFSYYPLVGQNFTAMSASLGDIRGHFMYFTVVGQQ